MSRTPIVVGNWKMNKAPREAIDFAQQLEARVRNFDSVETAVAPTSLALSGVADALQGSPLKVAAQGAHWEASGAFTGQVAADMLRGLADFVILGHSEVRAYLAETDANVNRKANAVLAAGMQPIIAVGESLAQNEAGETIPFVRGQVRAALAGISAADMARVVIAYEPIWAIGTGKSATSQQADSIIGAAVRDTLRGLYGDTIAESTRIQYGGSVKPGNMAEFMAQPNIDGALVGGASLQVDDFAALVEIAAEMNGE
ncbi:MAG: triose-phosphate isomerase [Chloroflexi bacterium]|nr:triose-phosphate isomerase [Chloroflexota bacterium]MCY3583821.1 triose-phosphate isomerase [Chloroflexota bacterium]MCY3716247.1 triose-phosphate isomerase [Chloroflexota bacterium]MDE2650424.1 triose-phosphate isomerase [Chloroflexota bacterium]MXX52175.1 triose-phosphate isomerase [Chloroflexota bacterium]